MSSNNVVKDLFTLAKNGPRLECIQGENNVCIIYYTVSTLYAYKYFYTSDFLYKWLDNVKAERDRMLYFFNITNRNYHIEGEIRIKCKA